MGFANSALKGLLGTLFIIRDTDVTPWPAISSVVSVVRTTQCAASGATLVSAADILRAVAGCSRDYAGQMLRRLHGRVALEVRMLTPTCGGRPVAFCDAAAAAKLLMVVPANRRGRCACGTPRRCCGTCAPTRRS